MDIRDIVGQDILDKITDSLLDINEYFKIGQMNMLKYKDEHYLKAMACIYSVAQTTLIQSCGHDVIFAMFPYYELTHAEQTVMLNNMLDKLEVKRNERN